MTQKKKKEKKTLSNIRGHTFMASTWNGGKIYHVSEDSIVFKQ